MLTHGKTLTVRGAALARVGRPTTMSRQQSMTYKGLQACSVQSVQLLFADVFELMLRIQLLAAVLSLKCL